MGRGSSNGPGERNVSVGVVDVPDEAKRYIAEVLDSNRLSAGKYTRAFETEFARRHDCRHAVFMNSGTSALQVALAAMKERHGWDDGDEVIVPAVTFIATSNVVLYNDLVPRFVDVDPESCNIDPDLVEDAVGPRTRAVVPVHLFGRPCDMDPILETADRHGLEVLEDSCETMFARYRGRSVGSLGSMACFSTYAAHLLVTGVGGLVATDDDEYATMCRSLMAHGRDSIYLWVDDDDEARGDELEAIVSRRFSFVRLGFSYRLTELEAALGLADLERADSMIARRKDNAAYLTRALEPLADRLQLPVVPDDADHVFMVYPIVVKEGVDREALVNRLEHHGVETRPLFDLLRQPIYRELFGDIERDFPVARRINQGGFYVGCHHRLERQDLDHVAAVMTGYFE